MAKFIFRCKAARQYTDENGNQIIEAIEPVPWDKKGLIREDAKTLQDCLLDVSDGEYVCYENHCIGNCSLQTLQFTDEAGKECTFTSCSCSD